MFIEVGFGIFHPGLILDEGDFLEKLEMRLRDTVSIDF